MMEVNNVDEEDEDVVIQGSALHEHLSQLGYTDFESVPMSRKIYVKENPHPFNKNIKNTINKIYIELFSFYSWITQEKNISRKQLNVIQNANTLLTDHSATIKNILKTNDSASETITLRELIMIGIALISSTYLPMCNNKILMMLLASSTICGISYMKHLRFCAHRDLEKVVLLQNEIFVMCKKSLKILRCDYKIKAGPEKCFQQFFHFLGEKLHYLQPLTETLIKSLENICYIHYQCSLLITKLLPSDVFHENLFTKFEYNSIEVSGEINYQILQKLYHTYLLIQSEMLYLLAIAYDSSTWIRSCQKLPETKLAHIVHILTKRLTIYKLKLSEIIDAYHIYKAQPIPYKTRGIAKWHNPTIQLDLASHKLQLAYNQIFSIFQDMDDRISHETIIDNETAEILMKKLDGAFKEISTAKIIAEFVILLMAKSGINNLKQNQTITNGVMIDQNPALPVIIDSDPEILDEVFEEYITEEHLQSLYEETDEYSLEQYKLDKLLAKSFMIELKEALVDKHKSMSERESKALHRTYKNVSNSTLCTENKEDCHFIPAPPPMPHYYIWSTSIKNIKPNLNDKDITPRNFKIKNDNSSIQEKLEVNEKLNSIKALKDEKVFNILHSEDCGRKNEQQLVSVPQILLETQATQFVMKLPPAFLQEEVFIGSGENSEDEIIEDANKKDNIIEDANEKDENNENK